MLVSDILKLLKSSAYQALKQIFFLTVVLHNGHDINLSIEDLILPDFMNRTTLNIKGCINYLVCKQLTLAWFICIDIGI